VGVALIIGLGTSTWLFLMERATRQRAVAAEQQQVRLRQEAEQAEAREAELRRQAETREKITQATVLVSQDRFEEADRLLSEVSITQPTVEGAAVIRSLGEWHALQNRWRPAADRFTLLLQIDKLDGWDVSTLDDLECGPILIELGDLAGYERFRQAAIAHVANAVYPFTDRIIKISLLLPADEKVMKALNPLAEAAAKSFDTSVNTDGDVFLAAWRSVSMALMEYRRGNYAKAAAWCKRCLDYPEYNAPRAATARVIMAMSRQHLGQTDAARSELTQARGMIEDKFKNGLDRGTGVQGFWFDWVFARILLREAAVLIEGTSAQSQ